MRRSSTPRTRQAARLLCAVLLALLATSVRAHAAPRPLRLLVRVTSTKDLALLTRLRGLTSDLAIETTEVPTASLEPTLTERFASADLLLRQLRADAIVWTELGSAQLFVARPAPGYVLSIERPAIASGPGNVDSTELEQTAVLLRRALRTLLDGGIVGTPRPAAMPPPSAPVVVAPQVAWSGVEAPEAHLPVRAIVGIGAQQLFDGVDSTTGIGGRGGVGTGRLELSLHAELFRERNAVTAFSRVALERRSFGADAAFIVVHAAAVDLLAHAGLARVHLARLERSNDSDRQPELQEATRFVPDVGLRVRFPFWRPGPAARVAFWAGAALDVMLDPPSFSAYRLSWKLGALEPRVGVGLEIGGG